MSDHMPCLLACVGSNKEYPKDTNIIDTNLVLQTRKLYSLERDLVVQMLDSAIQPVASGYVISSRETAPSLNSELANRCSFTQPLNNLGQINDS